MDNELKPNLISETLWRDLRMLIVGILVVICGWLMQGWVPGFLMGGNDTVIQALIYREIAHVGGDWTQNIYTPLIFGGVETHPTYGTPLFYRIFSFFSLSPDWAFNLYQILFQICFGFLALKWVDFFTSQKAENFLRLSCYWILLAWTPILSWRLYYGHQTFVFGMLVGFCLYLIASPRFWHRFSILSWLILGLTLIQSLTAIGPQMLVMSCLFFAGVWISLGEWKAYRKKSLIWVFVFLMSCFLMSLPSMWDPLIHHSSLGSTRSVKDLQIATYFTPEGKDLFRNLFWNHGVVPFEKPFFFLHEAHYPIGAFILFLLLLRAQGKPLKIWFLLYAFFVLALTYGPVSGPFRVPFRGFIPFFIFIQILFISFLQNTLQVEREKKWGLFEWAITSVWIWILWISPVVLRECVLWIATVILLWDLKSIRTLYGSKLLVAFSVLIFMSSVENKIEFAKWNPAQNSNPPENRFNRSWIKSYEVDKGPSTSFVYQIPAIDGYWLAPRPFLESLSKLENRPLNSTLVTYMGKEDSPYANELAETYNIHGSWFGPQKGFVGRSSEIFKNLRLESECSLKTEPKLTDLQGNSKLARIDIENENECLLSVAMNSSPFLVATGTTRDGNEVRIQMESREGSPRPFFRIPAGLQSFEIRAETLTSSAFRSLEIWGLGLFSLCLLWRRRLCKE